MMEPSLDFPPVYRRMLSGGPARLRLSRSHFGLLLASGVTLAAILTIRNLAGTDQSVGLGIAAAVGATVAAMLTGAIAARWLGSGAATLAGMIYLGGVAAVPDAINGLFSATALTAIGSVALATVPGRLPVDSRRAVGLTFYFALGAAVIIAGPRDAGAVFTTCLVAVLISENMRELRFFFQPLGVAVLALATTAWWAARHAGLAISFNGNSTATVQRLAIWPEQWQTPVLVWMAISFCIVLASVALITGLRQGHMATPFWRFVGCWVVAPFGLAALGMLASPATTAMLWPPLAIIVASGAAACWGGRNRVFRGRLFQPKTRSNG